MSDNLGNWRQNNNGTNLKETFNYDNLDRLDNVYQGITNPVMSLDMAYDANKGGITTKTDVGTLLYSLTSKPYAVSHIAPVTSIVPTALDSLTYTSFESVSTIEEGIYTASFLYNPEDQRAKMEIKQNGSALLTMWYLGSNYIKETASGLTKEYTFIGGDAYSAPVVAIKQSGTTTLYYLLRDHLGSITHVVNASTGLTVYEYSYDAWGRMRNTSTWTDYAPGSEPSLFVAGRGFTGHEHLPWFNLINMNGRIYDPLTGQFLNPDNNVQSPDFTQNFNRYAYCLNNPLIYTDPSGEFIFSLFLGPLGAVIDAACWSAAIDAGIQGFRIATGKQDKFNWAELGGAAIGGAAFGGMGLLSPSFSVTSTSFMSNLPKYAGKAGWAALSGAVSTGAGMYASDLFDNSQIDYSGKDYLRAMGTAGLISGGLSFAGSIHDYATWDKYTPKEKIAQLQQEFHIKIDYDAANQLDYAYFDQPNPKNWNKLFITDKGLATKGLARTSISHELIHFNDFRTFVLNPARAGLRPMSPTTYGLMTERNAYFSELLTANKYRLSYSEWLTSANGARYYGVPSASVNTSFNFLMFLRMFF